MLKSPKAKSWWYATAIDRKGTIKDCWVSSTYEELYFKFSEWESKGYVVTAKRVFYLV